MALSGTRRPAAGLTKRGWGIVAAAIVLFAGAYILGSPQLLFASCLLGALVVLCVLLVRFRSPRLSAARRFDVDVVSVGSPVTVSIEVANDTAGRSASAQWRDRLPWTPGSTEPAPLRSLPSARYTLAGTTRLQYVLHPPARGIVDVGPVTVERFDPFGLTHNAVEVGETRQLIVAPRVTDLSGSGFSLAGGDGSVRASRRNAAGNNDDLMTREYRSGDALRRVHWRATARHGDLMVRQEEESSFPTARLIVDTRDSGYATPDSFEWVLGMVASLGVHLVGEGFLIQLRETGAAQLVAPVEAGGGTGHDIDFLTSLASARPSPDYLGAGAPASADVDMHGPIFAILSRPSDDTLRWVASQRAKHEHGVALVVDDAQSTTIESLTRAGWQCVSVRVTDDPADVWAAALDDGSGGNESFARARFGDVDGRN
ncbi:DUF58 domain-containing protein [Conyzicola nivalis]|uniref:Membrane protein n=1 Tax=Conyzicola nivalis TaxID=1477021 RepID=A0A916WIK4_9MICO|nr:DUF58 domain-containing protein [Conyzicola nivalis]GGB01357.1 membrane protein [Conyzicola nivalis]